MRPAPPELHRFLQWFVAGGALVRAAAAIWALSIGDPLLTLLFVFYATACSLIWLLLRFDRLNAAILLLGIEIASLCFILVWLFGTSPLFHIHALITAPLALLFVHLSGRMRGLMMVLPVVLTLLVSLIPLHDPPTYLLTPRADDVWSFINLSLFVIACMGVFIYQLRQVEIQTTRAEQLADERGRMLSGLSHEVKTPLAAILAKTQATLSRPREAEAYQEALHLCERNARQLRDLALRMGEVSLERPEIRVDSTYETDPALILQELAETLNPLVVQKGFRLEVDCHSSRLLDVDPVPLTLILRNLVANALQHADGGDWIALRFRADPHCTFTVEDNGPGIPEQLLPKLFEPFTRGDAARGREEGSYGLGLAIARKTAESMQAELMAENRPEGGARFLLKF
jgi:signal transduction histidine kinase